MHLYIQKHENISQLRKVVWERRSGQALLGGDICPSTDWGRNQEVGG